MAARPFARALSNWLGGSATMLDGFKFSRQMPIAGFICDFLCRSAQLVIELDGGQHAEQIEQDDVRTRRIEAEGYRVLRFWNNEVNENLDGVLIRISEAPARSSEAHPRPLPFAGGKFPA